MIRRPALLLALAGGILAVSTGAIFVREAQQTAPSLTVAAGRLLFAALALAPVALTRHRAEIASLRARDLLPLGLSGAFLALHFATWITSLEHTTVTASVVLVTTTPLWVGMLAPLVLREKLTGRLALGIALALVGGVVVGISDTGLQSVLPGAARGGRALFGDFLALSGAWGMAGYLLVGRRLRARLTLVPYVFLVYGTAAVILTIAMTVAGGSLVGLPPVSYLWLVLLALVPQIVGHSTYNWALRYLPASFVAIAMLGEPVGASVLAFLFLREVPGPLLVAGAALLMIGIAIAASSTPDEATAAAP